jgi:hypothetical protein
MLNKDKKNPVDCPDIWLWDSQLATAILKLKMSWDGNYN